MHGLPGALGMTSAFPFVGRSAELERLRALLPRAEGEAGRVVLLGGEAGSGKSRLVREFAAGAAEDGTLVLYGACDAVLHTPYGPFVEALDQLVRALGPELPAALGASRSARSRPVARPRSSVVASVTLQRSKMSASRCRKPSWMSDSSEARLPMGQPPTQLRWRWTSSSRSRKART